MNITKYLTITIICLAFSAVSFAQGKEITKDEYYGPWRAALQKGRTMSRRNISKTEIYTDGKVSATDEWIYEYELPDKIRYIHIESSNGITKRTEQIDIGKSKYCLRDKGSWEQVTSPCIGGGVGGSPNAITTQYSVEKIKTPKGELKLYREYITYKNTYSKNKENEGLSYYEWKYWINEEGFLTQEENRKGLVGSKTTDRVTMDSYEYDRNIKIEAPIK